MAEQTVMSMEALTPRGKQVLRAAAAKTRASGATQLESRFLLYGLANDAHVWPAELAGAVRAIREGEPGSMALEPRGDMQVADVPMSAHVCELVVAASRLADERGEEQISSEHLALAFAESELVADARAWLRAASGHHDPTRALAAHNRGRLMAEAAAPRDEPRPRLTEQEDSVFNRVTALLYLLMRDEVPFGVVTRHIEQLEQTGVSRFTYTNKEAGQLAKLLANKLLAR